MGLLTDSGVLYVLYGSHEDPSAFETTKQHAGSKVELRGAEAERGGMKGIEVLGVKAL